jgi:Transposase IS66 family
MFTFLTEPGVQATNWRAEQALRPAIVNRKSWGGNRTTDGAHTQQITMSVIRTARQQDIDPLELIADAQHCRQPAASELIKSPPPRLPDQPGRLTDDARTTPETAGRDQLPDRLLRTRSRQADRDPRCHRTRVHRGHRHHRRNGTMHGHGTHAGPLALRRRLARLIADDEQLAS